MTEYHISILGSGVVGSMIGRGFAEVGYPVIFYDIDTNKVDFLRSKGYSATADLREALLSSNISFICVPTPLSEERSPHGYRKMDLSYIERITQQIAGILKEKNNQHTLVIKSTALPTTAEKNVIPILSKAGLDEKVDVCVNPEFLTEIAKTWTDEKNFTKGFFNEDRYVIGERFPKSKGGDMLEELYTNINLYSGNKIPTERVSLREAAWIKLVANAALATKISYFNSLLEPAKILDIDPHKTARIVGLDKRIGMYGTIHGKAFGGKCLPKDLEAFLAFLDEELGYIPDVLKATHDVNTYIAEKYGVRE
jgi:UDPglucose 6-dehydrogenase